MHPVAQLPVDASGTNTAEPRGYDVGTAVRRRDQPFVQVLQEVAAQVGGHSVELAPERQHGKPTVAGTRLPVSVVLTYLAAGQTIEEIAEAFPNVTVEQLRGAVEYAAEVLDQDVGL
ncbi:MAG: DUF433 domain-containing protein [Chloroflexota bacterium]